MNDLRRTTAQELTRTDVPRRSGVDMLFRITSDFMSEAMEVRYAKTDDVRAYLFEKQQEVETLVGVIRWQHSLLDYNSFYNSFLLDQLTEDEFGEIAERFAYEPAEIAPKNIAPAIERIYRLTGISYTPSDLAGLFKCNQENTMDALCLLKDKCPDVRPMLPADIG
jgi:hypothetical protein